MGCGHGIVGIMAKKLGASYVCLQDYNLDVLEKLTKLTVLLNCQS
jgi:predicted nicotinamide N-methyase